MADYAQIIDGKVNLIVVENETIANQLRATGMTLLDISEEDPKPGSGWDYDSTSSIFLSPIRLWAEIDSTSDTVIDIRQIREIPAQEEITNGTILVDITNLEIQPQIGWSYVDGIFSAP